MYSRIRKSLEEREEGFTLIELLVVVIIIGILAAIAIPVFLAQRNKAHDAAAKSDLKNLATAEEAYLTDNPGGYTSTLTDLTSTSYGFKQTQGIDMAIGASGSSGYCAVAYSPASGNYWFYDSEAGGLMPVSNTSDAWPSTGNPTAVACSTLPTNFSPAIP